MAPLKTRSIGQALTLLLTLAITLVSSFVAMFTAYFFVFDLPLHESGKIPIISATHFMVLMFAVFPAAIACGIFGGCHLWLRAFRALCPGKPSPDRLTEDEESSIERVLRTEKQSRKKPVGNKEAFAKYCQSKAALHRKQHRMISLILLVSMIGMLLLVLKQQYF